MNTCLIFSVHVNNRVEKSEEIENDQNDVVSNFDYKTHLRTCYRNIFWSVFVCGCGCMDVHACIAYSLFYVFARR
jgi:hypothetical protein